MAIAPVPTAIGPTGTVTTGTPTLQCHLKAAATHEPVHAQWQIANDAGFSSIVSAPDEGGAAGGTFGWDGTHYYPLPLGFHLTQGTYYIRARARSSAGDSAFSTGVSFIVSHPPVGTPVTPSLASPVVYNAGLIAFNWNFSSSDILTAPNSYQIQIIRNDGSLTSVWDSGTVSSGFSTSATRTVSSGEDNRQLAWRIRVTDSDGVVGPYSAYQPFYLQDPPAVAITAPSTSPVTIPSPTITHTFTSAIGAVQISHSYQVTRALDGAIVHTSGTIAGTGLSYDIPLGVLDNLTRYTVTAFATDANGVTGSASFSFKTSWVKPAVPTSQAVDSTPFSQDGFVKVTWDNAAADANYLSYRVYRKPSWPTTFLTVKNGRIYDGDSQFVAHGLASNNAWNDIETRMANAVAMGSTIIRVNDFYTSSTINISNTIGDEIALEFVDKFIARARAYGLRVLLDLATIRNFMKKTMVRNPYTFFLPPYSWAQDIAGIATRVNTVTGVKYADDPTIAWISVAGEPTPGGEQMPAITAASWSSGTATITIGTHGLTVGELITVKNSNPSGYNVNGVAITAVTGTTVSYAVVSNPGSYVGSATGYMYASQATIQTFYSTCAALLRLFFPNHLTTAGGMLHYDSGSSGGDSFIDWQSLSALDYDLVSLHVYGGADFPSNTGGTDEAVVPVIAAYLAPRSIPWVLEEFGIAQNVASDASRATKSTAVFNLGYQNGAQGVMVWNGGTELIETFNTLNFRGKYASGTAYSELDAVTDGSHGTTTTQTIADVTAFSGSLSVASSTGMTSPIWLKTSSGLAEFTFSSLPDGTHLGGCVYVAGTGSVISGAALSDDAPWFNMLGSTGTPPDDAHSTTWAKIKTSTFDVNPYTPLTFAAVQAFAPTGVDGPEDWTLLAETPNVNVAYEFDDYVAAAGESYDYAIVQVYSDSGVPVESDYVATRSGETVSDHYFLAVPDQPSFNMRLYSVAAETVTDEHESSELLLLGRGRQVQSGTEWGYRGQLTVSLRNIEFTSSTRATTARDQRLLLEQIKRSGLPMWLRNPFGDIYYVSAGDLQFDRTPGVGLREDGDLTFPYVEIISP